MEIVKIASQSQMLAGSPEIITGNTPTSPEVSDGHDDDFDW